MDETGPRVRDRSMPGLGRLPGALVLVATAVTLCALGLLEAAGSAPWLVPLQAALLGLFILGSVKESVRVMRDKPEKSDTGAAASEALAVLAAALATFALHTRLGLGSVAASSLVGLGVSLASRRLGPAAYCGSFVGMASPLAYETFGAVAASGILAALLYAAVRGGFDGFGGRLGTIALAGSLASALFGRVELHALAIPGWELGLETVAAAALGAVATALLGKAPGFDAVRASSLAELAAALALPALAGAERGATLALAAFTGSFVGMSKPDRLPGFWPVATAGAASGLVFLFALPWFGGAGGKLGAAAFVSTVAASSGLASARAARAERGSGPARSANQEEP